MRVMVFGANGYIGRYVTAKLIDDGHQVSGFARSDTSAAAVRALGASSVLGDLADPSGVAAAFDAHDAVIWSAQLMLEDERRVVNAFLAALENSGKAFVFTSGTSLLSKRTDGAWSETSYGEDDVFLPRRQIAPRLEIETLVREAASRGVRAMCVRPPLVWGRGGCRIISDLYHSWRKTGAVCYVGKGLNLYSNVHVDDLAALYALALERGSAGALYHAVSGEADFRAMAEAIARHVDAPTRSVSVEESMEIWDRFMGPIVFSGCSRTRAPRARAELGWRPDPERSDILQECANPVYAAVTVRDLPAWVSPWTPA